VVFGQTSFTGPEIDVGDAGADVNAFRARVYVALVPQGPTALTLKLPVANPPLMLSTMVFVVELPLAPVGNVHTYDVAPGIAGVEKTFPVVLRHTP
jgi:hypothetical protein